MSKTINQKTGEAKAETRPESCFCPFCCCNRLWENKREQYSEFFAHLHKARLEVLRGFRALIDDRISALEKEKRKVTKVKVE